jgi:carbon-monoxide dehydrogenase large subunit
VRSPHAHARIAGIDTAEAAALPGVVAVVTGREMAARCEPWVGVLKNYVGMKSAPQYPLALDKAVWQGEPVVAVVAESRALAEDGCARVRVAWEPLPPVVDAEAALAPGRRSSIRSWATTWCWRPIEAVTWTLLQERGRGLPRDLRHRPAHRGQPGAAGRAGGLRPADETLTVYHRVRPYMLHDILSRHLRIPEHRVRVINKDVGGSSASRSTPIPTRSRPARSR